MEEYPIEVKNLTIGYDSRIIMQNLNFQISAGQIVAVLGGSGCGKSTLLKHLIGLYPPKQGEILIDGEDIATAAGEKKRQNMSKFGVAYQGGALFRSMTLFENIALPLEEYTDLPKEEIAKIVRNKLALVDLDGYEDYMPSDISGGMIKRCAFARAMALDPKILFFDEPSAGLDPISSGNLDQLILKLRDTTGATIMIVTHELPSIFTIADRILMLDRETKGIIADGAPEYLRDHSDHEFVRRFLNRGILTQSEQPRKGTV